MDTLNEIEKKLILIIKSEMKKGKIYFKPKFLSQDYNFSSPKQIGSMFRIMSKKNLGDIRIFPYAKANSITWKVEMVRNAKT